MGHRNTPQVSKKFVRKTVFDLSPRVVVMLDDDSVDLRIDFGGSRNGFVEQFEGRDLFSVNQLGKSDRVIVAEFLEGHRVQPSTS